MTSVWRVEKPNGDGPYKNFYGPPLDRFGHSPVPSEDGLGKFDTDIIDPNNIFGFKSLLQFSKWFTPHSHDEMTEHGYVVREYDVPDNHQQHGYSQVLFERDKATLLREIKPNEAMLTMSLDGIRQEGQNDE